MEGEGDLDDKSSVNFLPSSSSSLSYSTRLWSQWQLLDSILPTGGFAHSFGLEAAMQARLVISPENLKTYVIHTLENTGSLFLPFVHATTNSPNAKTWHKLDRLLNVVLTNEVGRKASMAQGSALIRVAASIFTEIPALATMRSEALSCRGDAFFHHAPAFGLVCGLAGFDVETSQRAYMFVTMRDIISAATRLNLVGPLGAAVLQHQLAPIVENLSVKWMNRDIDEHVLWSRTRPYSKEYRNLTQTTLYRQDMVGTDVEKMLAVGLVWGATNAFMRRGAVIWDEALKSTPQPNTSQLRKWLKLLLIWQYTLPFLINLSASATFFAILSNSPISLAVPVTNATTFAATAVFGIILGEETRVELALFGTCLIVLGVYICIM